MSSAKSRQGPEGTFLRCNVCSVIVDGVAFITSCHHLFCPSCAHSSFASSPSCPCCTSSLSLGEVMEVSVGIQQGPMLESLYQAALQQPQLDQVVQQLEMINKGVTDVTRFVLTQQAICVDSVEQHYKQQHSQQVAANLEMKSALGNMREQLGVTESRVREMEQQLQQRSRDMEQLTEAYNEKVRKCAAWEKAYTAVREQLASRGPPTSENTLNAPLPQESPRMSEQFRERQQPQRQQPQHVQLQMSQSQRLPPQQMKPSIPLHFQHPYNLLLHKPHPNVGNLPHPNVGNLPCSFFE